MLALRSAFFAGVLSLMGACGGNEGDGDPAASPGSGGGGGGAGGAT